MAPDLHAVTARLAAQPAAEKVIRNQLISQGCSIREATARAARITEGGRAGQITEGPPAASLKAIAEAAAAAVLTATAARKAARRAADRAVVEAAVAGALRERQQLAAQFSETAIGTALREASSDDLAAITATALAGAGRSGPAARLVTPDEVTADPRTLSLEELDHAVLAATGRSAGSSPFWGGSPAGGSPFWRGMQGGAANA